MVGRIKSVNSRVQGVRGKRNQFAHFCWMRSNDNEIVGQKFSGRIPIPDKKTKDNAKLTMAQLNALYKECYLIVEELSIIESELPRIEEGNLFDR